MHYKTYFKATEAIHSLADVNTHGKESDCGHRLKWEPDPSSVAASALAITNDEMPAVLR